MASTAAYPVTLKYATRQEFAPEEKDALDKLFTENYPQGELRAVFALDNHRAHAECGISGAVHLFSPDAVVKPRLAPFGKRLFGHVMIANCQGAAGMPVNEPLLQELTAKRALLDSVPISTSKPYRLTQQDSDSFIDVQEWTAELGHHGHFLGVFKQETEQDGSHYFLAVHADAGQASQDLIEYLEKHRVTFAQMLDLPQYRKVQLYSQRNAQRLLSDAATALGLEIIRQEDSWARVNAQLNHAPPQMAVPDLDCEFNTFERVLRNGVDSVAFFSRAMHLSSNDTGAVHLVDPRFGMLMYLRKDPSVPAGKGWANGAVSAFPIGTGKVEDKSTHQHLRVMLDHNASARAYVDRILTWLERRDKESPSSNERTWIYSELTQHRSQHLKQMLGADFTAIRLKPVVQVIPPPNK